MKKFLYVLLGIVLLYLILALVGPKQVKVEREIAILRPATNTLIKLGDFKFFHDSWSPWTEKDTNMICTYEGTPGEIGHRYTWKGNKEVGEGEMSIARYNGDTLVQNLKFVGEADATSYFILKEDPSATVVTWGMIFDIDFFSRPIMIFAKSQMDKMLGADYEKGLAKLKEVLELENKYESNVYYDVEEIEWDEKTFVGTKMTNMGLADMENFFGMNLQKLHADIEKNNIPMLMGPCAIYATWDPESMSGELAVAACVPKGKKLKDWESYTFPSSKVLRVAYYGAYEKMEDAHKAIGKYIQEKGYREGAFIEEYVTDPMNEPDTTRWLTNIYYLLN